MKLRSTSTSQQLLFLASCALLSFGNDAPGQGLPAIVKLKTGATQQGGITGVTAAGVGIQLAAGGSISIPLSQIASVSMAPPLEYNLAMQAVAARDLPKASAMIGALVAKYKGLPVDWAQQAAALAGFLALQSGDMSRAELAFFDFKKSYPEAPEGKVGSAAIAESKKDYAAAKDLIAPIIEEALKQKDVPLANRFAFSRAFYISGKVKESEKDLPGALEDYLRTITIFYHDTAAVASAQERADVLRKNKNKVTVPYTSNPAAFLTFKPPICSAPNSAVVSRWHSSLWRSSP